MSTIGITTNLMSQGSDLPSTASEFVTDLNHLAHDLESGDLAAARTDYVLFSEAVLNIGGVTTINAAEMAPVPVDPTASAAPEASPASSPVSIAISAAPGPALNVLA